MTTLTGCGSPPRDPAKVVDPQPGIPASLATERAQSIRDVRYALAFDLPSAHTEPVEGVVTIQFVVSRAGSPVALDFAPGASAVMSVKVGNRAVQPRFVQDHIILPAGDIAAGSNTVEIAFRAGDAALNRNADFLYTLFVPARAHLTFPCFDQPDLKARFALSLTIPGDWRAVSNGAEHAREAVGDRLRIRFAESAPIPTYLFAFAAGRFEVDTAERRGRTFHMYHRETDAAKLARNRDAIFDLHASALQWLEDYTGIPYPFGKFDFVLIPAFQFGGMEHPGSILYRAESMLLDESATENQVLGRASLISHETSHMWFGDLVTMRWFDDVWTKEVFANFMAAKIVNPSFKEINHELRFLMSHYPPAYGVDRTEGTHQIRQPLDNLNNAGSQYGAIIYQKAPIVMRQLELLIGEAGMRAGLREYVERFQFGNATWRDLIDILDGPSSRDLVAWSQAWVEERGRPTIRTELATTADGTIDELSFVQEDSQTDRSLRWTQSMRVVIGTRDGIRDLPAELSGSRTPVAAAKGLRGVTFVLPTGGGLAYGNVVLDDRSRQHLLTRTPDLMDPLTRGAVWVTLWEELLERRVRPQALLTAILAALPREAVQQNTELLVARLRDIYWRFLSEADRLKVAPAVERAMRDGMSRSTTAGAKSVYFGGLQSMALTPAGVAFLERVWARRQKIEGLPFAEADEAAMALALAVRSVPETGAILEAQRGRFTNPDRKARFEFVMRAASPLADDRRAFFQSLADVNNRRRESWVVEALGYLHHPLRAAESVAFVQPSLELLQEIQQTGDIFFPTDWMRGTLSGHRSPAVAHTVRAFLQERPDYPVRLRRVILQQADELFRAAVAFTSTQ